ncbi:hypothetical protein [Nocardia sp. NPDC058666]|uniref:hypothetical protein n=1 Tax=unclassified Nocardia TaxID=2637762 RepID=UPI0036531F75
MHKNNTPISDGAKVEQGEPKSFELSEDDKNRVNDLIQKSQADFSSTRPDVDLEVEANSLRADGLSWSELTKKIGQKSNYRKHLSDVLARHGYVFQSIKVPGSAIPQDVQEVDAMLSPRPTDSPAVERIKSYGRGFVENRRNKSSRQTGGNTVGEMVSIAYLRHLIREHGGEVLLPLDGDEQLRRGAHTVDVVAIVGDKIVVIEAKANTSGLSKANVRDDHGRQWRVLQGTRLYIRYKLRQDKLFLKRLKDYDARNNTTFYETLAGHGKVKLDYLKVHAPYVDEMSPDGKPTGRQVIGTPTWSRFTIGSEMVDLVRSPKFRKLVRNPKAQKVGVAGGLLAVSLVTSQGVAGAAADPPSIVENFDAIGQGLPMSTENSTRPGQVVEGAGGDAQSDGGTLAVLKAKAVEFGRMLSSFKDHVQNGLNRLATMAGDAAAKMSAFVSDVVDSAKAQELIEKVSNDWAFAQELLNIAMLFSPVGTVAAAISAAVPIIQLIVEHWDEIRAAFDWVLKNVLTPVAEFFMTAFKVYVTPYRLVFDAVMAGFNGMGGVVGGAVGAVRSTVAGIVKAIGEIFQRLEINIGFPVNKSFGLKSVGDAMVAWASERLADGGLVGGQGRPAPRRGSGIEVMAVIDRSVLRAAQAEERKIGYVYRPPFLHDGALPRTDNGPGPRTFDVRVADVDAAFAQIRMLQAVQDARFSPVGV